MEYYSAIKKNSFESVLMRWMKLEPIIQSEVSQKDKDHYSILKHIYGRPCLDCEQPARQEARSLISPVSGKRAAPAHAGVPKPGRQSPPPRTGHPHVCRVVRANRQLSLLGFTRCSARRLCKENSATQEMEVWNLPKPHLSSLLSPLTPDGTTPFFAGLLPKGLGPEHTWELGGSYNTVSPWTVNPRRSSEAHKGIQVGRPPTITSQSPRGVQPPSLSPSSPEALSSGRSVRDKVTNSTGRSCQIRQACPACEPGFQSPFPPS